MKTETSTLDYPTKFAHPRDISCQHPAIRFELFLQTDRPLRTYGYDGEDYWGDDHSVESIGYYNFTHSQLYEPLVTGIVGPGIEIGAYHTEIPAEVWEQMRGQRWVSHNVAYDVSRHARMVELGLVPNVWPAEWVCTMNLTCFLTQGARSLKDSVELVLGRVISKDTRAEVKNYHWTDILRAKGFYMPPAGAPKVKRDRVLKQARSGQECFDFGDAPAGSDLKTKFCSYVISDARCSLELWDAQHVAMPPKERILSAMTIYQGLAGFAFDAEELTKQIRALKRALWSVTQRLPWVTRWKLVPMSQVGLARVCAEHGVRPPKSLSKDDDSLIEWLDQYENTYTWVSDMKLWRELNDAYQVFTRIESKAMPDGRSQFAIKYAGAGATARWAGDGGLNLQAMRKSLFGIRPDNSVLNYGADGDNLLGVRGNEIVARPEADESDKAFKKRVSAAGLELLTMFKYRIRTEEAVEIDVRGAVRPRRGYKIVTADLSQIEPRCQAWYAGNWELLEEATRGVSCYIVHAKQTMGADDTLSKKSLIYKLAKMRVLALGYGAGWWKFYGILKKFDLLDLLDGDVTEMQVQGWSTFAQKYQPEAFAQASQDPVMLKRCVRAWSEVESFRHSHPLSQRWDKRAGKFYSAATDLQKKLEEAMRLQVGQDFVLPLASGRVLRYRNVHPTEDGWVGRVGTKEKHLYSGLLFENLIQAVSRDVFGDCLLRLLELGVHVLFTVHDEAVMEVPLDFDVRAIHHAMTAPVPYMPGLPISIDLAELDRYAK